ncbi:hypothetical protein ACVWWO_004153 [Bradyrhizobium sp. F1.13.1]
MRKRADGDIEAFGHRIDGTVDQDDLELQLRVLSLEGAEHIGKPGDGQRCRCLDTQMIDKIMAFLAHARQEIADIGDHAPRPLDIFLTRRGQPQLPRVER